MVGVTRCCGAGAGHGYVFAALPPDSAARHVDAGV